MRILSLDISASPGISLLEVKEGVPKLVAVDNISTDSQNTDSERYEYIKAFVTKFIYDNKPIDKVVREKFIKGGSKRSTQLVFGSWAAIDLSLGSLSYTIDDKDEIVASRVKKYIGGKGGASKDEVAAGVIRLLGEEVRPLLYTERGRLIDDRADAIAIGLAWAMRKGLIAND